jgi:hypothetical protein
MARGVGDLKSRFIAILVCLLIQPWCLSAPVFAEQSLLTAEACQAAEILGIRQQAEQIISLNKSATDSQALRLQRNVFRSLVLRKVLQAVLQVQATESRLEGEMAYTYDVMAREQRKTDTVDQFFNILNFAQLSVLYGFVEPYSRINKRFTQSAVGTCVGSGLAIGLPILNIFYDKCAKASHLAPPKFLSHIIDGGPVDGSHLAPLVVRYFDLPAPGSSVTRREALNALWKQRYRADMAKKSTLCGIDDGKSKKSFVLNTRIELLWSLYTTIQGFNKDLLSLLNQVSEYQPVKEMPAIARAVTSSGSGADEAARLLELEPLVAELKSLNESDGDERKFELRLQLMERLLAGYLDLQIAADRCQEELNYQYDVVLAQMTARRGKYLQKTYEANFIQTGTLGACAGWSYLNQYTAAGNELFIVSNSLGLGITTISLLASHGGWRKNRSEPNSLADFFNLRASGKHGFSPLVWNYLNSSSPKRTDGKSRREYLQETWSKKSVSTMDLKNQRNLEKLGSMPSCKWDTINLVLNRIHLLTSLRDQFTQFDNELLDLLRQSFPATLASDSAGSSSSLSPSVDAAANWLGVKGLLADASNSQDQNAKLLLTRSVFEAFLTSTADANTLGQQIVVETQTMNRMIRQKDKAIQYTNIANFYQLGILGIISDSLGLSSKKNYPLYGDRVNLVSGGLIAGFAGAALLERRGGVRLSKAEPNAIAGVFQKPSTATQLSPVMIKYLKGTAQDSPTGLTRREELIKYWNESKILNVNVKRESTIEKLSAEGKAHHWWSESIKLINNRVTMLYDLRAVLRTSNTSFDRLLAAVD